ncbi:outer membrane protein assembly factor BamE [Blochmannia endosymbiont of Camponotus nipponensis]|uniref:outer membrane protein assembly factor BamE n=1 Tax=Blochmannia endosymbiont of Camponotus nipponensis TaxID=2681986 RepID=UPI00135709D9|nr:outer membrane protein assembly factor BamE [Blochmannia endosymbiont of Camponotus nipponensis]
MYFKVLYNTLKTIVIAITMVFNVSCAVLQYAPQSFNIKQGNYLNEQDVKKIHIGMTKLDISFSIGAPTLQGLLEPNIWYYIFYHRSGKKIIEHQILELKFDAHDILTTINKK